MKRIQTYGHRPLGSRDPVDLHLHTVASDGFWTADSLTAHLAEKGFRVAAVCDHDTQRSVAEAVRLGEERGVVMIPGVEVTCRWDHRQLHILVYGIHPERTDAGAQSFRRLLRHIDDELHTKAEDARRRFESSGRALPSLEDIRNGRYLWPFHVLSAVIKDKHAPNLKASAELLVELGGCFTADLPLGDVVDAAHMAGGICVIAHPGRADAVGVVTESDLDRMLAEHPLDGLEAHYRSYTDAQTELYRRMALDRGLLISCGSDSHAPAMPVDPRPWRAAWCEALLRRLGLDVEPAQNGQKAWAPGMDPNAVEPAPESALTEESAQSPEQTLMNVEAALEAVTTGA